MATTRSSAPVRDRARWPLAALLTCFLGVLPAPAAAITAFGLSNANQIVTFDTNPPTTPLSVVAITGLQSGETAWGSTSGRRPDSCISWAARAGST